MPEIYDQPTDVADRLAQIESQTQGTLPGIVSLGLSQTTFDIRQVRRASALLARYFDLPPQWFFQVGERRGITRPGEPVPVGAFTDPVTGIALSLATARRLIRAHEQPAISRMLQEIASRGAAAPTVLREREGQLTGGSVGQPMPDSRRVAETIKALAPLRGEELGFASALAFSLEVARSDVDIDTLAVNLRTTSALAGLDPMFAAEIARRAAADQVLFRTALDVARYVAPGAAEGLRLTEQIRQVRVDPRTGVPHYVSTTRGAAALGPLAGQPGFERSGPLSELKAEYELGEQIVAGLTMPGDFFESLKEANDDYIAAGEEIANRVKIPFSDSWFGKAVGTLLDYAARPLDIIARYVLDASVIVPGYAGHADSPGELAVVEATADARDIFLGRTTAMEELWVDAGIPPWMTLTAELFLGFYIDPVYLGAHAVSVAHARRTIFGLAEAGRAEEWGARVTRFVDGRVRRIGGLRNLSIPQYLVREASRSESAERFFGRAVDNFRTYFSVDGLHPLVAERTWRFVQSGRKLGLAEEEIVEGVRSVLLAGMGVAPPPNTLASHINTYVETIRARSAQQLPLFLADGARYEAGTTRLTHDAATALGALDDAYIDLATRGPRMLEIPHMAGPVTRAELALRSSSLADTTIARGIRNIFTGSPRLYGAHAEISIEQGAEAVRDWRRTLVRSQVYSADEIERGQLELTRAMRPSNPFREADFVQTLNRWNHDMLARIGTRYGLDEDMVEGLVRELERRMGRAPGTQQRVFGVSREGALEELIREPLLPSQAVNAWQVIDPMVFRRGVAETIGTWRKWRAAHLRAFGMGGLVPPARRVTFPIRRLFDTSLDLITRDLFLVWWKALVVLRPAYVLRVVGIEEQARFLATLGVGRRLRAGKILTGERAALVLENVPVESRLVTGAQRAVRAVPEAIRGEIAQGIRRSGQYEINVPELAEYGMDTTLVFPAPGHLPDEALANTIRNQLALATPFGSAKASRAMREWLTPGSWGAVDRDAPHFLDYWFNALGHQFGLDPVGRRYLDDIARGIDEETSVREAMAFLTSPGDGLRYAKRIMGPGYTTEALELQVRRGVRYARDLTREHADLAGAARDGLLSPEMLRAVPPTERPLLVHGPLINESVLAKVGPLKRGRDFVARWIVEQPTNRLSRQPYFKTWYDRMNRSLVETAQANGIKITPELLEGFHDSARAFAVGQVQRIMFDFSREGRIDQLTRHFLVFVQPFLEFPIVWSRIIRQNPGVLAVAARLGRTGTESGFLRVDEETGELVVPLSWWAGAAPLLAALTGGRLKPVGEGGGWELSVPLASFNLFAQSTFQLPTGPIAGELPIPLPSFNPEAAWALQQLLTRSNLRADIKTRLSSWLFAYGGIDPASPGNMLPAYLHHGLAALFPEWFESETNLAQTHFLQLQQAMGLEPDPDLAREQGRIFSGLRAFFAAVFPGAPRIEFPTVQLEDEWASMIDELGYADAREAFLRVHPGLDLITIARTMWAEENPSPVAIPASAAVNELLSGRGAQKFAAQHPQWTWAIIPSELRDGRIDPGSFFAQIAADQRIALSPEEFLERGNVQAGWDAYFALNDRWIAWQERHTDISEGDPPYIDQYRDYQAGLDELRELNPSWAAVAGVISLQGTDPRVIAEANILARDELFQQTNAGQWLVKYLSLRRTTRDALNDVGLHSIRTKTAERLGITGHYDDTVARLNEQYPDGATAYRLFFGQDLEHVATPGDRAIDALPEDVFDDHITPWWTRYERLRDAPDVQPGSVVTEGSRGEAFNAIRAWVETAYSEFDRKTNPLLLRWKAADPVYHQDALTSLSARWYPYMSRFDKDLLGDKTNAKAETLWTTFVQLRGVIAEREAMDPEFSSTKAYDALGQWVVAQAAGSKVFAAQVAVANTWGYALAKVVDTPRLHRQLFGSEIRLARPYWRALLDATSTIQQMVDAAKLGGSFDPKAKVLFNILRGKLIDYVGQLKEASAEFSAQWDLLEQTNGSDVLVASLMPEFSDYFGPIQGYPGD